MQQLGSITPQLEGVSGGAADRSCRAAHLRVGAGIYPSIIMRIASHTCVEGTQRLITLWRTPGTRARHRAAAAKHKQHHGRAARHSSRPSTKTRRARLARAQKKQLCVLPIRSCRLHQIHIQHHEYTIVVAVASTAATDHAGTLVARGTTLQHSEHSIRLHGRSCSPRAVPTQQTPLGIPIGTIDIGCRDRPLGGRPLRDTHARRARACCAVAAPLAAAAGAKAARGCSLYPPYSLQQKRLGPSL